VPASIKPLVASPPPAGLPITSLASDTPFPPISKMELWGQVPDEDLRRLSQVVYSLSPSAVV